MNDFPPMTTANAGAVALQSTTYMKLSFNMAGGLNSALYAFATGVGTQLSVVPVSRKVLLFLVTTTSLPRKVYESMSMVYHRNCASLPLEGTKMFAEFPAQPWMGTVTSVSRTGTGAIPPNARRPRLGSNGSFFSCSNVGRSRAIEKSLHIRKRVDISLPVRN